MTVTNWNKNDNDDEDCTPAPLVSECRCDVAAAASDWLAHSLILTKGGTGEQQEAIVLRYDASDAGACLPSLQPRA